MLTALRAKKSSFAAFAFAALLLTCVPAVHADATTPSWTSHLSVKNAAWTFFFISMLRFWAREPDNDANRYNLDELANGENVGYNLAMLYDDGFLGHKGKKPYAMIDPDNARLECNTPAYPRGLMGWAHYYFKPFLSAVGTVVFVQLLLETSATAKPGEFATEFFKKLKEKTAGFPKLSEVGAFAAIGTFGCMLSN